VTDGLSNTIGFASCPAGPAGWSAAGQVHPTTPDNNFTFGHMGLSNRFLFIPYSADGLTQRGGNCLINCTNFAGLNMYRPPRRRGERRDGRRERAVPEGVGQRGRGGTACRALTTA
jgi:hypothetical protein